MTQTRSTSISEQGSANHIPGPPSPLSAPTPTPSSQAQSAMRQTNGTAATNLRVLWWNVEDDTSSIGGATDDVHAPKPDDAYNDDKDRDDVNDFMPDDLSSDVGVNGDADTIGDVNYIDENDAPRERHGLIRSILKELEGNELTKSSRGLCSSCLCLPPLRLHIGW